MALTLDATVEIALTSGYTTPAASRVWTDVTDYVEAQRGLSIQWGRGDQFSSPQPSRLTVTLDNRDGRFTPENTAGAYYPNIKKGRPIRVRVKTPGNLLPDNDASFESSAPGNWVAAGGASVSQSSARAFDGSKSMLVAWNGGGSPSIKIQPGLTIGTTYTLSVYVYVPTGSPTVRLNDNVSVVSSASSVNDAWQRLTLTFVASSTTQAPFLQPISGTSANVYVDAAQLEVGSSATAFKGYTPRFLGYVDEWPVEWPDGTSAMSTVTVTALSRQARLGRSTTFKSIVEEEILSDGPSWYWPLGEPRGATTAGNIAPGRTEILTATQNGAGGTLEFGEGTGPGTDDLTAPVFTPASSSDGLWLATTFNASPPSTDTVLEVECFFATTGNTISLVDLQVPHPNAVVGVPSFSMYLGPSGALYADFLANSTGGGISQSTNGVSLADGSIHHVHGRVVLSGGNATASLMVDGGTRVTASPTAYVGPMPAFATANVGSRGPGFATLFSGTLAHVAIRSGTVATPDARIAAHAQSGLTGFSGEASGARIARYARLAGIPTAEISVETGLSTSIAHKDTTGELPSVLMQDVADTEDGVVFDGKDGTLTFHARSHRYGATSAFTLDANLGDIEDGFAPKLDDQHLTNDMTASRPNGIKVRSTNDASIAEYGYYRESTEILTTVDNEVQARADWEVNRFGTPRVAIPNVRTNLLTSSVASALLAADIGTKFTLTNLPSQAPATTADYFIEGGTEEIGVNSYFVEFNVSPAAYANVWILDDPAYSVLDSTTVLAY